MLAELVFSVSCSLHHPGQAVYVLLVSKKKCDFYCETGYIEIELNSWYFVYVVISLPGF